MQSLCLPFSTHTIIHHSFADDLQLQMSAPPDVMFELLYFVQSCTCDVNVWTTANMLNLNDNKTEHMLVTSMRTKHLHRQPTTITFGNDIEDNGVDLLFVTRTWLSAQDDEAKTVELAPSGFDVKSFPRQWRSRSGGIATVYKSTLGSNITCKTKFDFTHTSYEVVQASITCSTTHFIFFCLYRPPPNRRDNLTDYVNRTAA